MDAGTIEGALRMRDEASPVVNAFVKTLSSGMKKASGDVALVGAAITSAFGIAAIVAIKDGVGEAIKFEQAFAGVRKTVDGSKAELDAISDSFLELSTRIPQSVEALSKIGQTAGQLGVAKQDIVSFTETIAAIGVATNLSNEQAATSFAQLQNILGTTGTGIERLASAVVDLGNKGASSEQDITKMSLRLAGAGKQAGLTEAEVLGLAAGMANLGIRSEQGGSALSQIISKMGKAVDLGGEKLTNFAKVAGMTTEQFALAFKKNAADTIVQFVNGLQRIREEGGNVTVALENLGIKEIRQSDVAKRLSGDTSKLAETLRQSRDAWASNTALVTEAGIFYGTTQNQLVTLNQTFRVFRIELGQAFLPILIDMVQALRPVVAGLANLGKSFRELPETTRRFIAELALLAAFALPLVALFKALKIAVLMEGAWDIAVSGYKLMASAMTTVLVPAVKAAIAALVELRAMTAAFGAEGFAVTVQGWLKPLAALLVPIKAAVAALFELKAMTVAFGSEGFLVTLQGWGVSLTGVTSATTAVTAALTSAAGVVSIAVGALAALTYAYVKLTGDSEGAAFAIQKGVPTLDVIVTLIAALRSAWDDLRAPMASAISLFQDLWTVGRELASSVLTSLVTGYANAGKAAENMAAGGVAGAVQAFREVGNAITAVAGVALQDFVRWIQPVINGLQTLQGNLIRIGTTVSRDFQQALSDTLDWLKKMIPGWDLWTGTIDRSNQALDIALTKMRDWRKELADTAKAITAAPPTIAAPKVFQQQDFGLMEALTSPDMTEARQRLVALIGETDKVTEGFLRTKAAAEAATASAKQAAEQLQRAADALGGKDQIESAQQFYDAIVKIGGVKFIIPEQLASVQDSLETAIAAIDHLGGSATAAQLTTRASFASMLEAVTPLGKAFEDDTLLLKSFVQAAKDDPKAISERIGEWADAQEKLNDEIIKTNKAVTQSKAIAGYSKQFQSLAKDIFKSTDEIENLQRASRDAAPGAKALIDELIRAKESELDETFREAAKSVPEFRAALQPLMLVFPQLIALFDSWDDQTKKAPKQKDALTLLGTSVSGLAQAFANLSQVSGGLGGFAKGVGEIVNAGDIAIKAFAEVQKGITTFIKTIGTDNKTALAGAFADIATGLVSGFAGLANISASASTMQRAIQGAVAGAGFGAAAGSAIGAAIASNAATGAATGGAWGAAAGVVVGIFIGVFKGRATRKEMAEVGRIWGISISEGLADENRNIAKNMFGGDESLARIFNMKKILQENAEGLNLETIFGGGDGRGFSQGLIHQLRDVFSAYESGAFSAGQAQQVLNDNFMSFADVVVKSGRIANTQFTEILRLNQASGLQATEILAFVADKTTNVATGLAAMIAPLQAAIDTTKQGLSDGKITAEQMAAFTADAAAEIDNLGIIAVGAFVAARDAGLGYVAAVAAMGPGLDALITAQDALGIVSTNVALQGLQHFRDLVTANQTLVTATEALNGTLLALSQTGGLNVETLAAMESQGLKTFKRLTEAGFTEQESLALMKDFLLNVIEAHEQLGTPIDENTAALIDQADKYGLLKKDGKSMTDVLTTGFDHLSAGINALIALLGGVPLEFDKIGQAIDKIPKDIDINVIGNYIPPEMPDGGGAIPRPEGFQAARGGVVTKPAWGVFGEAGPEALIPLERLPEMMGMGGGNQYLTVYLDDEVLIRKVVRGTPEYVEMRGA